MSIDVSWSRQVRRWLRDPWSQGHMRTTGVVVHHPLVQETAQVVLGERNDEIQAFSPECPQQPFTQGIGLGTVGWCFQYPQPQMANPLVQSL